MIVEGSYNMVNMVKFFLPCIWLQVPSIYNHLSSEIFHLSKNMLLNNCSGIRQFTNDKVSVVFNDRVEVKYTQGLYTIKYMFML